MGNKESLIFVYMLNCTICILFAIIGTVMYTATSDALKVMNYIDEGGIDAVPEELWHHTQLDQFLEQRKKFKYALFMSIICFMIIFLSSFIRLVVTLDTIEKENRIAEIHDNNG